MKSKLIPLTLACLALSCGFTVARVSAQTTLFSAGFETDSTGAAPSGWGNNTRDLTVATNPGKNGSNTSDKVLTWTARDGGVADGSPAIDLTGYISGYTFKLSYDLYAPTSTNGYGLIIGDGVWDHNSADDWVISDILHDNVSPTYKVALAATSTWEHFSFDYTTAVNAYVTAGSDVSKYSLYFLDWNTSGDANTSIDNITFTATAVPEPSTYAVFVGLAVLGFAFWRRQRRRRA